MNPSTEARILATRTGLGLSQKHAARAIGIAPATLSRAEAGTLRLSGKNRDKAEQWLSAQQEQTPMADFCDVSAIGRIDGTGRRTPSGSYVELVISRANGTRSPLVISEGNASTLLAELRGLIEPKAFDGGPALPPEAISAREPGEPTIEADRALVAKIEALLAEANRLIEIGRDAGLEIRTPTVGQQTLRLTYAGRPYLDRSLASVPPRHTIAAPAAPEEGN